MDCSCYFKEAYPLIDYCLLFGIVFGVNLLPAFGPPTWSVIVIYGLNTNLSIPSIVLIGAIAAAAGRYLLACAFRILGGHISDKMKRNVAALSSALSTRKRSAVIGLGVFALSPVPSAQLFEAAGLSRLPLLPFTAAFFVGRMISYSIYAVTAKSVAPALTNSNLGHYLSSPLGITVQVGMIALLIVLTQIDWERRLSSKGR